MIRKRVSRTDDGAIYNLIIEELVPQSANGFHSETHSYQAIRDRLNHNVTFVAISPMVPLRGFISIQQRGSMIFIDMLAVRPSHRGRGIGKLLMHTAERYGVERGCSHAQLYVDGGNSRGLSFYRNLGYEPVQYKIELYCYVMFKRL